MRNWTAVGIAAVLIVVGYFLGSLGKQAAVADAVKQVRPKIPAGDDQPIVVAGGSFAIRNKKKHGFKQSNDDLVHVNQNRELRGLTDITDKDGDHPDLSFSGAVSIQFAYCRVSSACEENDAQKPDDLLTLTTDANRKKLKIAGGAGTTVSAWNKGNQEWDRLPLDWLLAWIKVSDDKGNLLARYTCTKANPCYLSMTHYCDDAASDGCQPQ